MNNKNDFERISEYLKYEGIPRTPHEISVWTGIKLRDVYDTLKNNKIFFIEVFDDDNFKGWIIYNGYF